MHKNTWKRFVSTRIQFESCPDRRALFCRMFDSFDVTKTGIMILVRILQSAISNMLFCFCLLFFFCLFFSYFMGHW